MATPNQTTTLATYMKRPDVITKFTDIMGEQGKSYVQSVLIAVTASPELMKCTNESVMRSALRAASLGLSCDPALKQAWLVPYNKKVKVNGSDQWVKEAQFQPHYKGLYTLAMRTGKYWNINVSPVYEGQRVLENPLTGLHVVQEDNGFVGKPSASNPAYIDVTVRRRKEMKVIGWIGYFKTKRGFEKSIWRSVGEIEDHAARFVKDYDKNPNWSDPDKRPVMEMKTVLRELLSWADMSGTESSQLAEALQADEPIDAQVEDAPIEAKFVPSQMTHEQARLAVGELFHEDPDKISLGMLNGIYWSVDATDLHQEAIRIILREEYNVEPPDKPKVSTEKSIKELGY